MHNFILKILVLYGVLLMSLNCHATTLETEELIIIQHKLASLPITREILWSFLFPKNKSEELDIEFMLELDNILKTSLIEGDTQVNLLTPQIRNELSLDRGVVAFHKQGLLIFNIIPSRAGEIQRDKQNDTIRQLSHPYYFSHQHNVFVADEKTTWDLNTFSLLIHELSHVAFDQWISKHPEKIKIRLLKFLTKETINKLVWNDKIGVLQIDGDLYDLLSERYAFELEYRLNRQITKINPQWPFNFSFTEYPSDKYFQLVDEYVHRQYEIDHPELFKVQTFKLDGLLL